MSVVSRLALLVGSLAIAACGGPDWVEFRSVEGGFSVLMPARPLAKTHMIKTLMGDLPLRMQIVERGDWTFSVAWIDNPEKMLPAGVEKTLDDARDRAAVNIQGKVLEDERISLDQNSGREIVIEDATGELLLWMRLFVVGQRLYMVEAAMPRDRRDSDEVTKYLDSFALLSPAAS